MLALMTKLNTPEVYRIEDDSCQHKARTTETQGASVAMPYKLTIIIIMDYL